MKAKDLGKSLTSVYIYTKYKRSGVALLITDKPEFKTRSINRHTECHFMKKGSIHQEYLISLMQTYLSKIGQSTYNQSPDPEGTTFLHILTDA